MKDKEVARMIRITFLLVAIFLLHPSFTSFLFPYIWKKKFRKLELLKSNILFWAFQWLILYVNLAKLWCPVVRSNTSLYVAVKVFMDVVNFYINKLSTEDYFP